VPKTGNITLEKYDGQHLCIRMRFTNPETGQFMETTFTSGGFKEGLCPKGILLWEIDHLLTAMVDYAKIIKTTMEMENNDN
jgi:hypothetical protein